MPNPKRILVLAPHTDDGEFGCGGTIARLVRQGHQVYYVAFSTAEESVPEGLPRNILELEVREATRLLGVEPERLLIYRYTVRTLHRHRQEILEEMVRMRREIQPDLVLLPCSHDLHQDHETVHREALRAFRNGTMLGYEMPRNNITFTAQAFVVLTEEDLARKVAALQCYESQKFRGYTDERYIRALALTRGVQIGVDYAEAFEVLRWVMPL
ncbi:MAG: PIG-L deacetylase family protein [Myxococcales bacterium]|nr:PIG-L family deacetylase [Myxococcota bacterium]MDW8282520.1 PIG-L deacetylase family protein [Myxococcales bacterium]